jgi:hypothetical protein
MRKISKTEEEAEEKIPLFCEREREREREEEEGDDDDDDNCNNQSTERSTTTTNNKRRRQKTTNERGSFETASLVACEKTKKQKR